jgi:hypothetical protein
MLKLHMQKTQMEMSQIKKIAKQTSHSNRKKRITAAALQPAAIQQQKHLAV